MVQVALLTNMGCKVMVQLTKPLYMFEMNLSYQWAGNILAVLLWFVSATQGDVEVQNPMLIILPDRNWSYSGDANAVMKTLFHDTRINVLRKSSEADVLS